MANKIRKRYLVSEGDLFQLYADIEEVRRVERREQFMANFRKLLRKAQKVKFIIEEGGNDGTIR